MRGEVIESDARCVPSLAKSALASGVRAVARAAFRPLSAKDRTTMDSGARHPVTVSYQQAGHQDGVASSSETARAVIYTSHLR